MTYKVDKMYVVFDLDGDRHLISEDLYSAFEKSYDKIEESYREHNDEDIYYEQMDDLLDHFSKDRLEGESYYVVLPEDVGSKKNEL